MEQFACNDDLLHCLGANVSESNPPWNQACVTSLSA